MKITSISSTKDLLQKFGFWDNFKKDILRLIYTHKLKSNWILNENYLKIIEILRITKSRKNSI